ncbi:LytR C-terminal domain-containing protein [Candidatus Woesebacteria bacterium]|nr:LytR C-terminal domain-containing protein [Candidatus Woesebacteria bacterium]
MRFNFPSKHARRDFVSASQKQNRHASSSPSFLRIPAVGQKLLVFLGSSGVILVILFILYNTVLQFFIEHITPKTIVFVPNSVENLDKKITYVHLSPQIEDSYVVTLPVDEQVTLPGSYGQYRLSALYPLLTQEGKGDAFIIASYSRSLGVLIDTFYPVQHAAIASAHSSSLVSEFFYQALHTKKFERELFILWHFLQRGVSIQSVDSIEQLQKVVAQKKNNQTITAQCPISILNGSSRVGVATILSEIFERSGFMTIRIGSYPTIVQETTVYLATQEKNPCELIPQLLAKAFVTAPRIVHDPAMTTQYRAPVVIIIGEDVE